MVKLSGFLVAAALTPVATVAAPPPPGCMALATEYCNNATLSQCPHDSPPWVPLKSGSDTGPAAAWRCYAPECLTPNRSAYRAGSHCTAYCTRDSEITSILATCRLPPAPPSPPPPPPPTAPTPGDVVWPPLQSYTQLDGSVTVDPSSIRFEFEGPTFGEPTPTILQAAFARYRAILEGNTTGSTRSGESSAATPPPSDRRPSVGTAQSLDFLTVSVVDPNATLGPGTLENYTLAISAGNPGFSPASALIKAETVFGALWALETFAQLALSSDLTSDSVVPRDAATAGPTVSTAPAAAGGQLQVAAAKVIDGPAYPWRGFMVDTGRRFWPVSLLQWLMDAMALNKMNVLHLHLSDYCRFAVESRVFPELTANLTGLQAGFYTQEEVTAIVSYGLERGIRVVPEIDLPGHARGLLPLEAAGLTFCSAEATRSQVYDDPSNSTFAVLEKLLTEMAEVFPDPVMNMGSDETRSTGPCTLANTAGLERKVLGLVQGLGKRPMAWVNALTTTQAASDFPKTILDTWATVYGMPPEVTSRGFDCISSTYMYLNHVTGSVGNYTNYWRDIANGVAPANAAHMLGGEVSMWTDDYCDINQCGAVQGPTPLAAALYGPEQDGRFGASIAGVVFPRASVGAGSLWRYNPALDAGSEDFVGRMARQNARMAARGLDSCPNSCSCDQLTRCGKPYLD